MKPFLGIDITKDKKNEQYNGQEFVVSTVSQEHMQIMDHAVENVIDTVHKAEIPLFMQIIQWVCGIVGALALVGVLGAMSGEELLSFAQVYNNASWIVWLGGLCLLACLALTIMSHKKQKDVLGNGEDEYLSSRLNRIAEGIYAELGTPHDAVEVDILSFKYKMKDEVPIPKEIGMDFAPYRNLVFKVFVSEEQLCLTNLEHKYAFALSDLQRIRSVRKSISVEGWNKEIEPNKGEYKPYKIQMDNFGCVHYKSYYILELRHDGGIWGIYLPSYELAVFEKLTGLTAN